jgi:hypothetical protein
MRPTRLENKVAKVDNSTAKLPSFDDDEPTSVTSTPDHRLDFVLSERDVSMVQAIADEHRIPYGAALKAVLRDALDIYHWNHMRISADRRGR